MELRESGYCILICRKLSETPVRCGGDSSVTPFILPRYKTGFVSVFCDIAVEPFPGFRLTSSYIRNIQLC